MLKEEGDVQDSVFPSDHRNGDQVRSDYLINTFVKYLSIKLKFKRFFIVHGLY